MPAKVEAGKCTACGKCAEVCPVDAIKVDEVAVIDADACVDCGQCIDECPVQTISLGD
jgi:ferredoxin